MVYGYVRVSTKGQARDGNSIEAQEKVLREHFAEEGKAIARQRSDYREGRPRKYSRKQIAHALELLKTMSYKQVEEITGISKSTIIRAKRKVSQSIKLE